MDKKQIVNYLKAQDEDIISRLFQEADAARKKYVGDAVHLRGIIEFSNYCRQDCLYCGLRRSNSAVTRYRMTLDEIVACGQQAAALRIPTVVLQSGEDTYYSVEDICAIIKKMKRFNLAVTLSLGERPYSDYQRFKDAGADRYLLRFETSDQALYEQVRPGCQLAHRLDCLHALKVLQYQVGAGIMVVLPGQSIESIADDILLFRTLDLDMIGIGPFLPHPHTPLAEHQSIGLEMVLKTVALTRIVTRNTHIPATTAVGTLDAQGRQKALQCGANVIMPNITPAQYRALYEIYPDKICVSEDASACRTCVEKMILAAGRTVAL